MLSRSKVLLVLTCTCLWLAAGAVGADALPEGFRLEPVFTGLTAPSSVVAAPDGRILITERTTGSLRAVVHGQLQAGAACQVSVDSSGERGLLGVAVHPQFNNNGWVYLYYSAAGSGTNKVTRYTLGSSGCSGALDILGDLGTAPAGLRNGGGITFGADGKLYVATGDTENTGAGQDDALLMAKVLRVNDDGSVPADNPTSGSAVYAKGVRDGVGLAVGSNGQVYLADAGATADTSEDELNAVPAGGNLGWANASGNSGGTYDDPLVSWATPVGAAGLALYGATAFPDLATDGHDSDHDAYGPNRFPGAYRVDDDGDGLCVGSNNNRQPCTADTDCPPRPGFIFNERSFCGKIDEPDEYCPGGTPFGDDACGATGAGGIDEPDESFVNNLFMPGEDGDKIYRAVLTGAGLDELANHAVFLDSSAIADCPTDWTGVATGNDGFLYAVAGNGGGADAGGLYRVIHDTVAGPREVAKKGSHFPLMLDKSSGDDVTLTWEDLRMDAKQPRRNGDEPALPVREYTVWQGNLGTFDSHSAVAGQTGIEGTEVNSALRSATFDPGAGNSYFLVSARSANLEGTLGAASGGTERAGAAVTDLCTDIGFHSSENGFADWLCGQDFEVENEHGELVKLSDFRGHPILLDLSAIWCGPCQSEADRLEDFYQEYRGRGVVFLSALVDEDDQLNAFIGRPVPHECRDWSDRDGAPDHTFPCLLDPNPPSGESQKIWPLYNKDGAFPTNVVMDSGMQVVYNSAGYDEATIKAKFDAMLDAADTCLP